MNEKLGDADDDDDDDDCCGCKSGTQKMGMDANQQSGQ